MAVVINNPDEQDGSHGSGLYIGILVIVLFMLAFFYFGSSFMRGRVPDNPSEIIQNNTQPAPQPEGQTGENQINVPEQIDLNVDVNKEDQQ